MFDWDDANLDHIAQHSVAAEETEEALLDPRRVAAPAHRVLGERRRAAIGASFAGRLLFIVFTHRGGRTRIITARDVTDRERRRYQRR